MKWVAETIKPRNIHAKIEKELWTNIVHGMPGSWQYRLYVYENGSDRDIADDMQDDLETSIEVAFEDYGVPKDAWKQVE